MTQRLTLVAAAALISFVATPLVVRAGAEAPRTPAPVAQAVPAAVSPTSAAPHPACRKVRVVYAGYAAGCTP